MTHKQTKRLLNLTMLELFLHRNTGVEFAGTNSGKVGFQCTNPLKYEKWLVRELHRHAQEINKIYVPSVRKLILNKLKEKR